MSNPKIDLMSCFQRYCDRIIDPVPISTWTGSYFKLFYNLNRPMLILQFRGMSPLIHIKWSSKKVGSITYILIWLIVGSSLEVSFSCTLKRLFLCICWNISTSEYQTHLLRYISISIQRYFQKIDSSKKVSIWSYVSLVSTIYRNNWA